MRRRMMMAMFAALGMVIGLVAAAPPAGAASPQAGPRVTYSPPHILKKVILNETSVDGPSVWNPSTVSGAPGDGTGIIIAWTGTDPAHRLNSVQTYNGDRFFSKKTYNESSSFRPAVTSIGENSVILAWSGQNASHSLNVLCSGCFPTTVKLTLWSESSFTAPAIAYNAGKLWLAWAGIDANHSLNVLPIDITGSGLKPAGAKVTLRQFSSIARPSLAPNRVSATDSGLLMAWAGASPARRINFATSTDGVHWAAPASSPLAQWTASGPNMIALGITDLPHYFLAWTGTDPNRSINVQYSVTFPAWPAGNTLTTFADSALGGPSIANGTGVAPTGVTPQIVLVWTSAGPQHRLNVAFVGV